VEAFAVVGPGLRRSDRFWFATRLCTNDLHARQKAPASFETEALIGAGEMNRTPDLLITNERDSALIDIDPR